jgi:hypothetical protein
VTGEGWHVFLGPSLPRAEVHGLFEAEYHPPARMGDIYRILGPDLRGIVLIDGVFHGAPAIWHREVLTALDEGVPVLGASSMGALRAAELAPFGMRGIGTVFGWYRDGVIDGDDEVALLHGPEEVGWAAISLPTVTLRHRLDRAVAGDLLTRDEADRAVALARRPVFHSRTAARLIETLVDESWGDDQVNRIRSVLADETDVKADDARAALAEAARMAPAPPLPDEDGLWARALERVLRPAPARWRLDRLLRAELDGRLGETRAQELAAEGRAAAAEAEARALSDPPLSEPALSDPEAPPLDTDKWIRDARALVAATPEATVQRSGVMAVELRVRALEEARLGGVSPRPGEPGAASANVNASALPDWVAPVALLEAWQRRVLFRDGEN